MARIEGQIVINRPLDEVFAFVADERNEPLYNQQMLRVEQTSAGPIGLGTRFRAESRSMGRVAVMTIEITAYDPPHRLASSTHLDTMDIHGALTFEPALGGTNMHWSWELRPRGTLKLLKPLVTWMGRRQEQTIWTALKHYLEAPERSRSRAQASVSV